MKTVSLIFCALFSLGSFAKLEIQSSKNFSLSTPNGNFSIEKEERLAEVKSVNLKGDNLSLTLSAERKDLFFKDLIIQMDPNKQSKPFSSAFQEKIQEMIDSRDRFILRFDLSIQYSISQPEKDGKSYLDRFGDRLREDEIERFSDLGNDIESQVKSSPRLDIQKDLVTIPFSIYQKTSRIIER